MISEETGQGNRIVPLFFMTMLTGIDRRLRLVSEKPEQAGTVRLMTARAGKFPARSLWVFNVFYRMFAGDA